MSTCPCCGTDKDPNIGKPLGPYRASDRCAYCSGFPRTEKGRCWGMHGAALQRYLKSLVGAGKLSPEAAEQVLLQEQQRTEQPWR